MISVIILAALVGLETGAGWGGEGGSVCPHVWRRGEGTAGADTLGGRLLVRIVGAGTGGVGPACREVEAADTGADIDGVVPLIFGAVGLVVDGPSCD